MRFSRIKIRESLCYALFMVHKNDKRLANLPLSRVAFCREIPALLGISEIYAKQLISPPRTEAAKRFREMNFPKPFYTSRSGVRVWWVRDLEKWAADVRRMRRRFGPAQIGSTLLDRPELADQILGRSL